MPTGSAVVHDKKQFASSSGGNERVPQQPPRVQWLPMDERDGFISWLRGEFAAANAMIDSLCHHLRTVGDPGEYDLVIGSIQQRRCNWNPVLHMQQYFSIAEVNFSLQQAAMRKQHHNSQLKSGDKEFRRSISTGFIKGPKHSDSPKQFVLENGEKLDETASVDSSEKSDSKKEHKESVNSLEEANSDESTIIEENSNKITTTPQSFNAQEMVDGKTVNVVEGLKLYENILNESEISTLVASINEWRSSGRKGELLGHTYIISRRPSRGHGREVVQFGVPMVDAPLDDDNSSLSKVEPVPSNLQDIIDRTVEIQGLQIKPDACIIDIYNEGDHSQPYMWPTSYGKQISTIFLSECELVFGRVITGDHTGDYKGCLKFTLGAGSALLMEGRSSECARHALPSMRKQRMLVTLVKSHPKRFHVASTWGQGMRPQSRLGNHFAPPILPPPVFVGPLGYPSSPARLPPGTGVFLPPSASDKKDEETRECNGEVGDQTEQH